MKLEISETPQMKAMLAAIPYLEPQIGKRAAIFIKLMELKYIMESFETDISRYGASLDTEGALASIAESAGIDNEYIARFSQMMKTMRMMKMMEQMEQMDFSE